MALSARTQAARIEPVAGCSERTNVDLMDASGSPNSNREYYDAFSEGYESRRGRNAPGGYHELLDELESEFVARFGRGRDVLEVGCGTGLVLQRIQGFARTARGIDLSPGMLVHARERGLDVSEGSATELPFPDDSFDVACSFKVLAHVPDIQRALSEMVRVTRPGGHVVAEFYNPQSIRGLVKRYGPAGAIAPGANERNVYTRFDSRRDVEAMLPPSAKLVAARGVRIVTPAAVVFDFPVLRSVFRAAERALCDTRLGNYGGFWIAAIEKRPG
ncbi:MAG TPA: class I SAM-dependent methyltransferase [Polyangiaceae bacterium]|jgi:ubiquinone/menaquinone biosynthesis C-methylase UbiE|nr:class I SAM-dependent methyltransferase [Polyangiaceae bacterium]